MVYGGGVGGNSSAAMGPGVGGMSNGDSGSAGGGVGGSMAAGGSGGGMVVRRGGRGGGGGARSGAGGATTGGGGVASGPAWRTRVGTSFGSSSSTGISRLDTATCGSRRRGSDFGFLGGTGELTMSFPLITYKPDASTTPIDCASLPSSSLAGIFCVEGSPVAPA